jgi:hypothetical protein
VGCAVDRDIEVDLNPCCAVDTTIEGMKKDGRALDLSDLRLEVGLRWV